MNLAHGAAHLSASRNNLAPSEPRGGSFGHPHRQPSDLCETSSASSMSVPIFQAPLHPISRRRSSSISFERHDISVLATLADELDAEETDTDDSTVDDNETECDEREETEQEDPEENPAENVDVLLNRSFRGGGHIERRVSELSIDIFEDIREALPFEEEDDEEDSGRRHCHRDGQEHLHGRDHGSVFSRSNASSWSTCRSRRGSARSSSRRGSSGFSLVGRIEEDILAKAVADGKIVPCDSVSPSGRRSSRSSFSSGTGSRRVSFAGRAAPRSAVQDDILTALRELQNECSDGDDDDSDKEEGSPAPIADPKPKSRGSIEKSRDDGTKHRDGEEGTNAPIPAPLAVKMMEISVPSLPGMRPRRSSF